MLDESPDSVRSSDGSRFLLAVFGKHPAWSDHLEDIGIDTASLAEFKRWLYLDGIRSNLDTGAWENLPDDRKIDWNHRLFMTGPRGMIIARLWASSDGRGRRAYPMVAATHLPTNRLPADLAPLFDVLDLVRADCIAAATQEEVLAAARAGRAGLENSVKRLSPLPPEGPSAGDRSRFLSSPDGTSGTEGFQRMLHVMSSDLASFSPSKTRRSQGEPSRVFRVPVPVEDSEKHLLIWHAFFQPHLRPDVLWTAVHPVGEAWADILVGDTDPQTVYHFRLNATQSPPLTEIPFSIPPENAAHFPKLLDAFRTPPFAIPPLLPDDNSTGKLGSMMGRLFGRNT